MEKDCFFHPKSDLRSPLVRNPIKESGASKMVTNRFMPNLTMLMYIKRRLS